MIKKKSSELFSKVDPGLNVIDASPGRRKMSQADWEAAGGAVCPRCKQEVVWLEKARGVCKRCAGEMDVKEERDLQRKAKLARQIALHNARVDKKKAKAPAT